MSETSTETSRRGRTRDPQRYALYSQWLKDELGIEIEAQVLSDAIGNYSTFQKGPVNVEYNESRRNAKAQAEADRKAKREAAKAAKAAKPEDAGSTEETVTEKAAGAVKSAAKKVAGAKPTPPAGGGRKRAARRPAAPAAA